MNCTVTVNFYHYQEELSDSKDFHLQKINVPLRDKLFLKSE